MSEKITLERLDAANRRLLARVTALEEENNALANLIREAAPLAWVHNGDMSGAREWEVKAAPLVTRTLGEEK